jgi:hypothetical protein
MSAAEVKDYLVEEQERAAGALAKFLRDQGFVPTGEILQRCDGTIAKTILDIARETLANLVVVGTRGRTGVSKLLLGSVAEGVARRSTVPVLLDPRYPHAPQWLREVRGDSMNARGVFPGDLAHIVDFAAAGINLNTGMVVEVTRTRDGGGLREITLNQSIRAID